MGVLLRLPLPEDSNILYHSGFFLAFKAKISLQLFALTYIGIFLMIISMDFEVSCQELALKVIIRSQAWYNVSSPSCLKLQISSSCLAVLDGG
ncbi:hypothetical protein Tco_1303706 [Tanacetum coccineum]